jgi:hypothetical protein
MSKSNGYLKRKFKRADRQRHFSRRGVCHPNDSCGGTKREGYKLEVGFRYLLR